jgi:hypothetical protein
MLKTRVSRLVGTTSAALEGRYCWSFGLERSARFVETRSGSDGEGDMLIIGSGVF